MNKLLNLLVKRFNSLSFIFSILKFDVVFPNLNLCKSLFLLANKYLYY